MKHIFKKLHIGSSHDPNRFNQVPPPPSQSQSPSPSCGSDIRTLSGQSPVSSPSSPYISTSSATSTSGVTDTATATTTTTSSAVCSADRHDYFSSEEEFQVQLALAISVSNSEFRDKYQNRSGSLLNLEPCRFDSSRERDELAESLSRQYWDYNVLDYEEKVVDGFYDIYGLSMDPANQGKIPSLADLQTNLGDPSFEVIVVNRAIDPALEELEQVAYCIGLDCPASVLDLLVQRLADLVTEHMGGPVRDANIMMARWMERTTELRTSLHQSILPIGSLKIGLSRHRALLFKVLADKVGIPCRLIRGSHYTGNDDDAVNIIKLENGREFLVDLMAAPGTLIPADVLSIKDTPILSYDPGFGDTFQTANNMGDELSRQVPPHGEYNAVGTSSQYKGKNGGPVVGVGVTENLNAVPHSQDSIEDSKNLFADLNPFQIIGSSKTSIQNKPSDNKVCDFQRQRENLSSGPGRSPSPLMWKNRSICNEIPKTKRYEFVEGLLPRNNQEANHYNASSLSCSSSATSEKVYPVVPNVNLTSNGNRHNSGGGDSVLTSSRDQYNRLLSDENGNQTVRPRTLIQSPVANHQPEYCGDREVLENDIVGDTKEHRNNDMGKHDCRKFTHDRYVGTKVLSKHLKSESSLLDSGPSRLDPMLEDVAEWEILWEDLVIGERIGIGSYGEVYHADWNGTEVAVKKFLDQDFSGDALDEFRSEVRIMRRLRHPNVVLFMGAVTRPPNLSIVTEFLPRGSLYRILHRPNCQIDERQRIKMALDVAKGMNCLHTSIPTVVHRDLKSPNLLVDKNWNVKVCDFGLSRLKHHTFLSSKSTAGTPEWMAPEVLRNEQSNEKCDVYSFGVILWELATLRMPWTGMNPMQVVGAVGFQNRRLDIPKEVDPLVARIIWECWQTDPNLRPSFAQLTTALKPLQQLILPSHPEQQSLHPPQQISVNSTP